MKPLETERLVLRPIEVRDAPLLLELMNDPAFIEFVADRGLRTPADAERYIAEKMLPHFAKFGFGYCVVELKESGTAVGTCGLMKRDGVDDVDVGFSILRRHWRNGYAYEAARALMDYGRNVLHLPRVIGMADSSNEKSIRLLKKLGLRFERVLHLPGYPSESHVYG